MGSRLDRSSCVLDRSNLSRARKLPDLLRVLGMLSPLLVWLSHSVPAFAPTAAQLATLAARLPGCELVVVQSEPEFLQALPRAHC